MITSKDKVGFSSNVKATVKVNHLVPLAYRMRPVEIESEQRVTVVHILVFAIYVVSRSTLSDVY